MADARVYRDRAPGSYSGNIGGTNRTVTVPEDGTFETSDPDEISFVESVLGWAGMDKGLERKSPGEASDEASASEKE